MLDLGRAKSFQDFADEVFIPYISRQLETAQKIDMVWDVYIEDSLKGTTREKIGKGIRRCVAPTNPLPKKWKDFLRVNESKTELFKFLSQQILSLQIGEEKLFIQLMK